jgi:DHA1 family tetracycline resistance protein-like MFS transporter
MPVLLLIVGINFIGVGALIPVLPYTVIEMLGLPASVMTMLLASFALAMFVANPILGRLSDHYGRRRVLFLSLAVSAAAHLWFALSSDILSMFAARIIAGFASGNTGVIQAMIADRTTDEKRAQYMGLLGAAIGVGFVAGPALGGLFSHIGGGPLHQAPFLLAAGFSLLALILTTRLKAPPDGRILPEDEKVRLLARVAVLTRSPLALYAAVALVLNLAFAQVEASFVLVLRDYLGFGARETGWLFTYIGVCIVIVQAVLIRHIVARFGEIGAMGLGGVLLVSGQIMTVLAVAGLLPGNSWPLVQTLVATTAICFGFAVASPALSSVASKVAGRSSRGGSLGVVQGFGSLGQVMGLVVAGPLYDLGGTSYPFSFGALVMFGMLAILPFLVRPTEDS